MFRVFCAVLFVLAGCKATQRSALFHPTHHRGGTALDPWMADGKFIGYCREVPQPENIWLMLHGNAGQAADRVYALPCFSRNDSVFIVEYPGYGQRKGKPSRIALDRAAMKGYAYLRERFPDKPVSAVGESIGSGPACVLAGLSPPPDKIVLVVPFDNLKRVAANYVSTSSANVVMRSTWNNVAALSEFRGPVDIYAAEDDEVIPVSHAKNLASRVPTATLYLIEGGHNDWLRKGEVRIRNP